jgi:uncharacterized protein (TIGR04255 family)
MVEQQLQQVALLVGPSGPAQAESQTSRLWQFTDDNGWTLSLGADNASLSVGPTYGAFEHFADRFRTVLAALAEVGGVTRCDRLGIRYVNIAEVPAGNPGQWREWFRPEVVGWIGTDLVAADTTLVTSITQTQLTSRRLGNADGSLSASQGILRHGYIPPNTTIPGVLPNQPQGAAFLLDLDLFVDIPQPFDADQLTARLESLHAEIDRFFRWSLTPAGEAYFGLEDQE